MSLQVKDWDEHFENNKSRERDQCSFVCVPNKQDGMGLNRIRAEPDGAAIYGIWCLIIGACSRQSLPRDGHLTDTGRAPSAGTPWTAEDLAFRWRRPVAEVERALQVLMSPKVGWIIDLNASARVVPAECPSSALEGKGREGNRREENTPPEVEHEVIEGACVTCYETHTQVHESPKPKSTSILPSGFLRFWSAWPKHHRKTSRTKCSQIWKRENCEAIADHIIAMVEVSKKSADWMKDGGAFIPAPMVWLNQGRWDTDPSDLAAPLKPDDPWGVNAIAWDNLNDAAKMEILGGGEE
jgi:hypothetical protein